jgi:hypothetical protein
MLRHCKFLRISKINLYRKGRKKKQDEEEEEEEEVTAHQLLSRAMTVLFRQGRN